MAVVTYLHHRSSLAVVGTFGDVKVTEISSSNDNKGLSFW